jgi:hypothetical protein
VHLWAHDHQSELCAMSHKKRLLRRICHRGYSTAFLIYLEGIWPPKEKVYSYFDRTDVHTLPPTEAVMLQSHLALWMM